MTASATFTLSAFGDEIADELDVQLQVLADLNVRYLELRGAWGKNVLGLSDEEVEQVRRACSDKQMAVSAIGSPVGKSALAAPIEREIENLRRLSEIAHNLETRNIRVFSFYPEDLSTNAHYDQHVDQVIERLQRLAETAKEEDVLLLLENEKEIVGDTVERCATIMDAIHGPHVTFAWDPANFVQVGEANVTDNGWPKLGKYVGYVHIKDATMDGHVTPAGDGDGQVPELLKRLKEAGYQGFLALEPHLAIAGHSSGFSGPDGMAHAVKKLRSVMAAVGCKEIH